VQPWTEQWTGSGGELPLDCPMQVTGCGYVLPQLVATLNLVCGVPSQMISLAMAQL